MARFVTVSLLVLSLALSCSTPALAGESKEDKEKQAKANKERQEIRKTAQDILARLYKAQPSAKAAIGKAAGYAVFSNFGMKILVAGSGTGKGVAVDNKTKKETFMKMVELQAGLGFGVKKFSLVWVFETPKTSRRSSTPAGSWVARRAWPPRRARRVPPPGRHPRLAGRLGLPAHRDRRGPGAHGQRDEVL